MTPVKYGDLFVIVASIPLRYMGELASNEITSEAQNTGTPFQIMRLYAYILSGVFPGLVVVIVNLPGTTAPGFVVAILQP